MGTPARLPGAEAEAGPDTGAQAESEAEAEAEVDAESEALDAYSSIVTAVAERLLPSVAALEHRGGAGSAVVFTPDGCLVTSAHVVERARRGTAVFADGAEAPFDVVGSDRLSDLAVVRADASGLPAAPLGDASRLRVGQLVVAIGTPLGFAGSVSAGVVSAVGRSIATGPDRMVENVIQTDAALHPGNSGGALATSAGRVVGINTAVVGPGIGQGLGLAVPVDATTLAILTALTTRGRVRRGFLGVGGGSRPLPPRAARAVGRDSGVEVLEVAKASPAHDSGIRLEDVIVGLDGRPVRTVGDLQALMTEDRIGHAVPLRLVRGGEVLDVIVVPTELR